MPNPPLPPTVCNCSFQRKSDGTYERVPSRNCPVHGSN